MSEPSSIRVDAWLWAVRLFPSRSKATAACRAGHVRVREDRAKPATTVAVGDRVVVRGGPRERIVVVRQILRKRVGAALAVEAYTDESPPPPPKLLIPDVPRRDRGAGRPTKRERREITRLRGY